MPYYKWLIWLIPCLLLNQACHRKETVQAPAPAIARAETVISKTGLKAWLVNEPSIPIIAVRMAWPGGAASDPDGLEGTTDLLAYMMNEGAGDMNSLAYAQAMEALSLSFGCSTGPDWTECSMLTLSEHRDEAFALLRDGLTRTRFDEAPFQRAVREKQVEIRQAQTNPRWLAARARDKALRPGHPYSRFPTASSIEAISTSDLKKRQNALMTRNGLLLSIVGDIDAESLAPLLDSTFGSLPETPAAKPLNETPLAPAHSDPIIKDLPRPQTMISFYAPGPKRDHPDYIGLYVLNHILGGGGFSSRLMDELREKRGLTYGIRTGLRAAQHGALWSGQTQTRNETALELVTRIKDELSRLHTQGPTQAELTDTKSYLTGAYPLSFDSNAQIASQLMYALQNDLGADYFVRRNALVDAVSLEDLQALAKEWLAPEKFTFVLVGQPQ